MNTKPLLFPPAVFLAAAGIALLAGCAGTGGAPTRTALLPFSGADSLAYEASRAAEYRIQIGDAFKIDFKYQDELDQARVSVLPDGKVSAVGCENVQAAGRTVAELDAALTGCLAADYLNPDLSIVMIELGVRQVYVMGEVKEPGMLRLPDAGAGVLQAIALAGGFSPDAAKSEVLLVRITSEGYLYRIFDFAHLQKMGLSDPLVADLQPYDIVYVPRSTVGDISYFHQKVLAGALDLTSLFWEVHALFNIDKIDRILR